MSKVVFANTETESSEPAERATTVREDASAAELM
jgi:hypothetical protein